MYRPLRALKTRGSRRVFPRKYWNLGSQKCHFQQISKDISINKFSEGKCSSELFIYPCVEFKASYNTNREITRKGKTYCSSLVQFFRTYQAVDSKRNTWRCSQKIFKKSYQFLKYARAYLRKGRYAPELCHCANWIMKSAENRRHLSRVLQNFYLLEQRPHTHECHAMKTIREVVKQHLSLYS